MSQVVKLPGGGKARLMCDKHPAGPLDVPDPANYKDIKVVPEMISSQCLLFDITFA